MRFRVWVTFHATSQAEAHSRSEGPRRVFRAACGSVANSKSWEATMCAAGWQLCGHAEDGVDELALCYSIALSTQRT